MKTNKDFIKWLESEEACQPGIKAVGKQTPQDFWNTCNRPDWIFWLVRRMRKIPLNDIKLAVFYSVKILQPYMKDARSIKAMEIGERFLKGKATSEELKDGITNATEAARAALDALAARAALDALAARAALDAFAALAALDALDARAALAALAAFDARAAQCDMIRKYITPNWDLE